MFEMWIANTGTRSPSISFFIVLSLCSVPFMVPRFSLRRAQEERRLHQVTVSKQAQNAAPTILLREPSPRGEEKLAKYGGFICA
jgi:hypothetical protein